MARRGSPLLAFAAGAGGGYLDQTRQNKLDQERQQDRDMRQTEFDARMDEVNRGKQLRTALADATRPAMVNEKAATLDVSGKPVTYEDPGVANSDFRQARTMGQEDVQAPQQTLAVNGKSFADRPSADAAAADFNKPEARTVRMADAYRSAGMPDKAIAVEESQTKLSRDQADYAKKLKEEGVFNALRAFRAGDASGIAKNFNEGGQYKIDGTPEITREDREVPGVGTVPTYNAKIKMVGPDGQVVEKTYNSHDLSMQMMPYEKALELQRKGTDSDNKATYQGALIEAKNAALEAKKAALDAKGNGTPTREERLRYASLFSDAGRRVAETQKAISSLQKDPVFMSAARKPGSAEAGQLADLQATLKSHNEERSLYQGMLAGSQTGSAPSAPKGPGNASEAAMKDSASGDMGADPAAIRREIASTQQSLGNVKDPASKQQLTDYLADLQGQLTRVTPRLADAKPTAAGTAPAASKGPVKVGSAAERDALPKGATYIAPNGQTYIKQ